MNKMVYSEDKEALLDDIAILEAAGFVCEYDEPRWNNFGECWIMMMENPTD